MPAGRITGLAAPAAARSGGVWGKVRAPIKSSGGGCGGSAFFQPVGRAWRWGRAGLALPLPAWLTVPVQIIPGVYYPAYRLSIIVAALAVAALLYIVVMRTRLGMLIRAGASNREMIGALGINIKLLFTLVFGLGAALAGLAGLMQAPILTVQIGMGENILILAFVIIVIGGIGSIRGAFLAAIFVGLIDTLGRAFLPDLLRQGRGSTPASPAAPPPSPMLVFLFVALVLGVLPAG